MLNARVRSRLILFGCLNCMFGALGQTKLIVDSKTKYPLDYVAIQSDKNNIRLMSNKEGKFILISDKTISDFTFFKMGYAFQKISLEKLSKTDTIFMTEKPFLLGEVTVHGKKIDTIVKDKRFYVEDYTVLANGGFLLINSKINVSGVEVCYYDKTKGIRQVKKIKNETGARFTCDCFKNIHLLTDRYSRQIFFDSDSSFEFLPKYSRKQFDSTLSSCALLIDTLLIMKEFLPPVKMSFKYAEVDQSSPYLRYYSVSKHSRNLYYTATYSEQMQEMISHEIADTRMTQRNEFVGDNQIALFFSKIAGPLYAPVFLKNDTVILFNFQEKKIVYLDRNGLILKLVKINDELLTKREFEVLYDAPVQKFYLKMKESDKTVIKQIDIFSGRAGKTIKLEKIFATNVQILNDRIYYLVKEKEWDDTRYLYQQN